MYCGFGQVDAQRHAAAHYHFTIYHHGVDIAAVAVVNEVLNRIIVAGGAGRSGRTKGVKQPFRVLTQDRAPVRVRYSRLAYGFEGPVGTKNRAIGPDHNPVGADDRTGAFS